MKKLSLLTLSILALSASAQNTAELKKQIAKKDMAGAFKTFVSSPRGSSSRSPREISFRASLLERLGLYHLAIQERARLSSFRRDQNNDGKLGNLSLLIGRFNPVLGLSASRVNRAPVPLQAAYAIGRLNQGNLRAASSALPANNRLLALPPAAPSYRALLGGAGIHLAMGRYDASMNLLGAEYQKGINFDLGVIRLQRARLLFDAKRYSDVLDELLYLPKTSASWYQGQMVGAWSAYYLKDYNLALGILMNTHSPYLAKKFNPESFLLESAVLYRLCYYESSQRSINKLRNKYRTLSSSISRFSSYSKNPVQLMNILGGYARGKTPTTTSTPQSDWDLIVDGLLTEQVIADLDQSLTLVAQEKAWVEQNLNGGQFSSIRNAYLGALKSANSEYYRRASRFVGRFLNHMSMETREALEGALAVDVEVNTRIRDRLLSGKTPQRKEIDFDREVKKGFEFWPFEGEFWRDETGSYAFATSDVCEGR